MLITLYYYNESRCPIIFFLIGDVFQEPCRLQDRNEERERALLSIKNTQKRPFVIRDEKRLVFLPQDNKSVKY